MAIISGVRHHFPLSSRLLSCPDSSIPLPGFLDVATKKSLTRQNLTRCIGGGDNFTTITGSKQKVLASQLQKARFKADEQSEEIPQVSNQIQQKVEFIREILQSIDDGKLSISAYDTAWVALVKDVNGNNTPQFPSALRWIICNQLPDGSWGDPSFFSAYDRLSCTLACVIALKTWKICPEGREKGLSFLQQNLLKLKDEDPEHQLSGFEVTFTSLIKSAEKLGLVIVEDPTVLQDLYAKREKKLKRIPMDTLHNVPTTLLHSLEGIPDLDWEKLLKLQHENGSFLCSPSSTAYALMQTKDENCFKYLKQIVDKFNGVPHTYPIDLFERLWVVDRLDRLGLSRHFKEEVKGCLDYVYRYWGPNGISWSRNTIELDIDDTSMGFRLLRLHGYDVKADAFQHFEREGQFYCFVGQMNQGITEMLSLFRASQLLFPGEKILREAKNFAFRFLSEKQDMGQVTDRWLVTKNLAGEVKFYLDAPWYAILPRIETRYYIDQYGGDNDVWIAKVLYRMHNVSNNDYLELAKLDYNHCQRLHQLEWIDIRRWYEVSNLRNFGLGEEALLRFYFLAMSSIFEPERAVERLGWTQTAAMIEAVSFHFKSISLEQKKTFIQAFDDYANHNYCRRVNSSEPTNVLVKAILKTMREISLKVQQVHGKEVYENLQYGWSTWLQNSVTKEDNHIIPSDEAELLVHSINLCAGNILSTTLMSQPEYLHLANHTNEICNYLRQTQNFKAPRQKCIEVMEVNLPTRSIEKDMQELVQHVLQNNKGTDQEIKQTFLMVAKSYYYIAYCESTTVDYHIAKVLFENVF